MRAVGMIVIKVGLEKTPEMPLVQHDDMVEHFTPDTADESLDVWGLPWTAGGDRRCTLNSIPQIGLFKVEICSPLPWPVADRRPLAFDR